MAVIGGLASGEPFRLARGYASNMVLQMGPKSAHIWGRGDEGAEVTLAFGQVLLSTTITEGTKWDLHLPPQPSGGPHKLSFAHVAPNGNTTSLDMDGVLFGDVWLCLGEGNMEFFTGSLDNFEEEVALAEKYKQLRILHVGRGESATVQLEIGTNIERLWNPPDNETLEWFSAECAFFGEMMSDAFPGRPIGLIAFAWTLTPLQSWLSSKVQNKCQTPKPQGPHYAGGVHNAIIYPLRHFTVRGALWDHGESVSELNSMTSNQFLCATSAMVDDWRSYFYQAYVPADERNVSFPVGIIQLGPDSSDALSNSSAPVRVFQSVLLDPEGHPEHALTDVFTASTYDLVDNTTERDWFSKMFSSKRKVAERLILSAKSLLYENDEQTESVAKFTMTLADSVDTQLEFTSDIAVSGESGFAFSNGLDSNWSPIPIIGVNGRQLRLKALPSDAKLLSYASLTTPCFNINCSIYDPQGLPLQPLVIQVISASTKSNASFGITFISLFAVVVTQGSEWGLLRRE